MVKYIIAPWVTDYINIEKQSIRPQVKKYLSQNPHDGAVDMLMSHPELIDEIHLCSNPNPRLTNRIMDIVAEHKGEYDYWEQLLLNSNDKIVDYVLSRIKDNKRLIYKKIYENPNPKIVNYLLDNFNLDTESKEDPSVKYFIARNSNDKFVDYILSDPSYFSDQIIKEYNLTRNSNTRIVELLLSDGLLYNFLLNKNPLVLPRLRDNIIGSDDRLSVLSNPLIFEKNRKNLCIKYKAIDWIDIDITCLSSNPNDKALDILERNTNRIDWAQLCRNTNPRAMKLLESYPEEIDMFELCRNSSDAAANLILEKLRSPDEWNTNLIFLNSNNKLANIIIEMADKKIRDQEIGERITLYLSHNQNDKVFKYLLNHPELIHIPSLAMNPNNIAVDYLFKHIKRLNNFNALSRNTNDRVVDFLIKKPILIKWEYFAGNENDRAVNYFLKNIENHIDEIKRYESLVKNKNPKILPFIQSIRQNLTPEDICDLAGNPIIFELDYKEIKKCQNDLKRELVQKSMNPRRVERTINLERERIRSNSDDPEQDLDEIDVDLDRIL